MVNPSDTIDIKATSLRQLSVESENARCLVMQIPTDHRSHRLLDRYPLHPINEIVGMRHDHLLESLRGVVLRRQFQPPGFSPVDAGSYVPFDYLNDRTGQLQLSSKLRTLDPVVDGVRAASSDIMQQASRFDQTFIGIAPPRNLDSQIRYRDAVLYHILAATVTSKEGDAFIPAWKDYGP